MRALSYRRFAIVIGVAAAGVMALGAQTATSSTVGPVDSTPPEPTPELQLSGKKKQELGKAVKVKARCGDPEACTARTARARGHLHWMRRPNQSAAARLKPASADLGPGETTTLKLKLTKKTRRRAGKALDEGKDEVRALIAVDATDADDGGAAKREIKIVK
jgi:hypothetical protein